MAGELPFLEVDGVELANAARVVAYARRFNASWQFLRRGWCPALDAELGGVAVAPASDPAPWYSAVAAESADFLGFMPLDIEVGQKGTRPAVARLGGLGGFSVGAELNEGEVMAVQGVLLAKSPAGLAYGRSWLRARLSQDPCNPCGLLTVRYREACPPVSDLSVGEWILYDAGVTGDGLTRGDADRDYGLWELVNFQLSSQHAYRFRPSVQAQPPTVLAPSVDAPEDWFDFSTDPFAGSSAPLVCATAHQPPGMICDGYDAANQRLGPTSAHNYLSFYRAGPDKSDTTVTAKLHTGSVANLDSLLVMGRWVTPAASTSRAVAGMITRSPDNTQSQLWVMEVALSGISMQFDQPGKLIALSAPFNLAASTDFWLRLEVSGDLAVFEIYSQDPYDSSGGLLGIAPVAATPWPPLRPMTTQAANDQGTWGIMAFQTHGGLSFGAGTGAWIDDLRTRDECMDFVRWFCEAPPNAASEIQLEPSRPGGEVAAVATLDATVGQIANAFIEGYLGTCPIPAGAEPFARIDVPVVPAGSVLVVDSARERITLTDAQGNVFDGSSYLDLPEGRDVGWIQAPACDAPICVRAGVSAWCGTHSSATIAIDSQERAR